MDSGYNEDEKSWWVTHILDDNRVLNTALLLSAHYPLPNTHDYNTIFALVNINSHLSISIQNHKNSFVSFITNRTAEDRARLIFIFLFVNF